MRSKISPLALSIAALSICLCSCASVTPVPPAEVITRHVVDRNFSVMETKSAFVGDTMIRVKDYYEVSTKRNAWSFPSPVKIQMPLGYATIVPGEYLISGRREVDGVMYDVVTVSAHPYELTSLSASAMTMPMIFYITGDGRVAKVGSEFGAGAGVEAEPSDFRASKVAKTSIDSSQGYTNFELVYTGLSSGVIRITYREYSPDDLARTAFFQDLTYNAGERSVRFRDLAIEILKATNEQIEYRVKAMPDNWSQTKS